VRIVDDRFEAIVMSKNSNPEAPTKFNTKKYEKEFLRLQGELCALDNPNPDKINKQPKIES
jgi:hypothetical protein